ncbi:proprotein convertase P-domain-containing protein [Catelliglobosispora koreensis]|uniref:proprotein convertase P-domain-containing protein n=1 Tax=Catelliglobosispora koreensis TaxID=129052 RepID=UPI00037ABF72|nr:proprotein convertase P-domain-containing protein [Catelliglobosispora koreensis]
MRYRLNSKGIAGLALAASLVASVSLVTAQAQASRRADPVPAAALAAQAARDHVAARPAALMASSDDEFVTHNVISSGGAQYIPHERKYKGLPVVGGDFVIVTDSSGRVTFTSVAQQRAIGNIAIKPTQSAQSAKGTARGQLTQVSTVSEPSLAVYALGEAAPALVWSTKVTGVDDHGHDSILSVYTDAHSGQVLGTREGTARGTGTGYYNGPNPLQIDTTQSGSQFLLQDPNHPTLTCRDYSASSTMSGPDDAWGNGDGTTKETACTDAMFAAQTQWKMLTQWLGRNGPDGSGGTWPMRVGWNAVNAQYTGNDTQYGYDGNSPQRWITPMDVVAHEIGHGIDDHTPGGISGSGTQEFIADSFGTATEWFANQAAAYDPPDHSVGEEVNLSGGGPIRFGHKPSLKSGHPDCYSTPLPSSVHAAAGPGNHWFYLLSQGTNPTNGQPASAACNGATLTGIGVQDTMKILYNAMLMKTSSSSYLKYRTWTLQSAKNLDATCGLFNKTKAAWDAVSVPAQTADPTCSASGTVTVTNPGNQTGTVGVAATLNMSASGGTPPYTWSATGLPAGLSINASSGQISGTPTTAGTSNVTVTASGGGTGSTSFTWTVNPVTPGGCSATNANDVTISDNATVESSIVISGCTGNAGSGSTVEVHIVHTYIGDLLVQLVAPDGTLYTLHNRAGGSADNINQTYTVNLSSEAANGTWKLRVNDNAGGDVGRIDSWTLNLGGSTPPPCGGTNANDVTITDNATVNSPITISGCTGNASATSTVEVHIVHTYIGDLLVQLVAPDGTLYTLHNRAGGSADNINQTYTVNVSSEVRNGTWNLRVNDNANNDVGRIDSWTLTL